MSRKSGYLETVQSAWCRGIRQVERGDVVGRRSPRMIVFASQGNRPWTIEVNASRQDAGSNLNLALYSPLTLAVADGQEQSSYGR